MNTKIKWLSGGLSVLTLIAALSGCTPKEPVPEITAPSQQTSGNTKDPLIHVPVTTVPETLELDSEKPTEKPLEMDPVNLLTCIRWDSYPSFLSLGGGKVLACQKLEHEGLGSRLSIVDIQQDCILTEITLEGIQEPVEQKFADGCFLLRDPINSSFSLYNAELQLQERFSAPNVYGRFSHDRKTYYYVDCGALYRMDVATGNRARMALEYDMRLESILGGHPNADLVVARCYLSYYSDACGICVIDCRNGKYLLLNEELSYLWLSGENFYGALTSDKLNAVDICYGKLEGGILQRASATLLKGADAQSTMLQGSGMMVLCSTGESAPETVIYDFSREAVNADLNQYDYAYNLLSPVYLEGEQLIFGMYPEDGVFLPVVIDPKALRYVKSLSLRAESWPAMTDRSVILAYQEQVEGPTLPDSLSGLRQQADALEQTYGVKIRLGEQTAEMCGSYAQPLSDPKQLQLGLNALEQALKKYPQGFLKQFQNKIGEGGLYFCLTGKLQGDLNPVGKTQFRQDRYEIMLDVTAPDPERTVHHELWHAMEMYLPADRFDQPQWYALNPAGFAYYGRYDSGYEGKTADTFAENGENCSFVNAYACINSREDRAVLMEYVMSGAETAVLKSPVLKRKLAIMSKALREGFDAAGWGTPQWERYL